MIDFIKENWEIISALGAVLGAIAVKGKAVLKMFVAVYSYIKMHLSTPSILRKHIEKEERWSEKILHRLDKLTYETTANGGKSLKDFVVSTYEMTVKNKNRTYLMLETSSIAMFECDETGKCIWVNPALSRLFGIERNDMLENGWLKAIVPEERDKVYSIWVNSIKNDIPYSCDYHIINQETGEKLYCRAQTTSTKYASKNSGYHGTVIVLKEDV